MEFDAAYLDPACIFCSGIDPGPEPGLTERILAFARNRGREVALETTIQGRKILITRGSGLFVEATGVLGRENYNRDMRDRDHADAARVCNLLICELALRGLVTRPFTEDELCPAKEGKDGLPMIWAAAGLRQFRSLATQQALSHEENLEIASWPAADETALQQAADAPNAVHLAEVSPALPDFIASALISLNWQRPAEAVLFAWIVAEQLVNSRWDEHVKAVKINAEHRKRLESGRDYPPRFASTRSTVMAG